MGLFSLFHRHSPRDTDGQKSWATPRDTEDGSFIIQDVFVITGRGPVFTGVMSEGSIRVGDEVLIDSPNSSLAALSGTVTAIETHHHKSMNIQSGDTAGLFINNIRVEDLPYTRSGSGFVLDTDGIKGSVIRRGVNTSPTS